MTDYEKYLAVFIEAFGYPDPEDLAYRTVPEWDSLGHMALIVALEDAFDIAIEPDDIVDFESFEKGKEILRRYDVGI